MPIFKKSQTNLPKLTLDKIESKILREIPSKISNQHHKVNPNRLKQ